MLFERVDNAIHWINRSEETRFDFINSYSLDKHYLPSNNLAPTLGVEFWEDEGKVRLRKNYLALYITIVVQVQI